MIMSPTVIDLTSSPEPDDSPETTAKTALLTFKPRKRREHRGSPNARHERAIENGKSPSEAAKAALQRFKPRKQKPFVNPLEDIRTGPVWNRNQSSQSRASNPSEGSLASLLQLKAEKSSSSHSSNARDALIHQQPPHAPRGDPVLQRGQVHRSSAKVSPTLSNVHPQTLNSTEKKNSRPASAKQEVYRTSTIDSRLLGNRTETDEQRSISSISARLDNSPPCEVTRPFKRRRTDESHIEILRSGPKLSHIAEAPTALASPPINTQIPIRSASPVLVIPDATVQTSDSISGASRPLSKSSQSGADIVNNVTTAKSSTSDANPGALDRDTDLPRGDGTDDQARTPESSIENETSVHEDPALLSQPETLTTVPQHNTVSAYGEMTTRALIHESSLTTESTEEEKKNAAAVPPLMTSPSVMKGHGNPYTKDEDALLKKLKEVDNLSWDDIVRHFDGHRSYGSLQVRYSTKLKDRPLPMGGPERGFRVTKPFPISAHVRAIRSASPDSDGRTKHARRRRNNDVSVASGFISWADVKKKRWMEQIEQETEEEQLAVEPSRRQFESERAYSKSLLRILRQRELGSRAGRSWCPTARAIPDELKEHALDDIGPCHYYKGTSGDVTCLAWASNGNTFAAGSIAISDERSMQYNRPCNLLLGNRDQASLRELPEHHLRRDEIKTDSGNINSLHSMRETQDPRLFMTVASVQFSPDGRTLHSAGSDRKARAYHVGNEEVTCLYELEHAAPLDLLSVSNTNVLATACRQAANGSISLYRGSQLLQSLSPSRNDEQTTRAIYPSALKWGATAQHSNLLLAGFAIDSVDEERNIAGETCLWDVRSEALVLKISEVTRNVFDVAWNPSPSSTSSLFAVASSRGTAKLSKGTKSVVQCFAPGQGKAKRVLEWECPAFDINDVVYCQHDDSLIAVGATDGKVYVWDQRFADRSNKPLHTFCHDDTLNILDHDRDREIADTGVRFLSWGATSTRPLYRVFGRGCKDLESLQIH